MIGSRRQLINSLSARFMLASALILPLFLGATGYYLDQSFAKSIEAAEAERLKLQLYTLLAEAEYDGKLILPKQLQEARFNQPSSGLYALVIDGEGQALWHSDSILERPLSELSNKLPELQSGHPLFERRQNHYLYSLKVEWETEDALIIPLQFAIFDSAAPLRAEQQSYRQSLLLWLGGSTLLLLLCQALVLRWGLRPLLRLSEDLSDIEKGSAERLKGNYPREVQQLTDNLNTLLNSEQQRRARVRNTLADLAHSLKTPLAVIRSADTSTEVYSDLVAEQTQRMEQIVEYQLQRAVSGQHNLLQKIDVNSLFRRLATTLEKVYADQSVSIQISDSSNGQFSGDERDLMELLGNLMDNACKYGAGKVRVSCQNNASTGLEIKIEDNGKGIPLALRDIILQRGTRVDTTSKGQGIGLSVVLDIVKTCKGRLEIQDSSLGGACFTLHLP